LKVKVIKGFTDLKENIKRKPNDIFEVTQERYDEINSTKYGKLVEKIVEKKKPKKSEK
jgi:hypothetical protein